MAGDTVFSRFNMWNTQRTWQPTGSYNTKATPYANWFIQIASVNFGGGNTSGTLGMAHVPTLSSPMVAMADVHWALTENLYYIYHSWLPNCGAANLEYELGVRLDDLIHPTTGAATFGYWNSN